MEHRIIESYLTIYHFTELEPEIQVLVNKAKEQYQKSYAPYSRFHVGASVLLENGALFEANNQENAAFPSGLCAERIALFYANAQFPDVPVRAIAIAAYTNGSIVENPITPCGGCRQVMVETQHRFNHPFDIYMVGRDVIYHVANVKELLPLLFSGDDLTNS
ncbi:MAG: cytidine deaminase [Paludibacter sp.]|jgi:cytidine deaminase|nr:cytidine deaminase [Paludibacter sp.]